MRPLPPNRFALLLFTVLTSVMAMSQADFDLQGHRGCRGLMPENTLPAFLKAVELNVTTLELDVVISKDSQIVVSHEPWMSHWICSHPDGRPVLKKEEKKLNLYLMNYTDIQQYDCGQRLYEKFPDQKKLPAVKPTLKMIVRGVRSFAEDNKYPQPKFNIEIKSDPKGYNTYQPEPAKFADLVATEIKRLGIEQITTLQSFDRNVLEELNKRPNHRYAISYLVEKGRDVRANLAKLSFKPDLYSPKYKLVSKESVAECHHLGIKIIPWTINAKEDMKRLREWGCDGGITDYPDMNF